MDPVLNTTPTKKPSLLGSIRNSIKSKISPVKPSPGQENASPKRSNSKRSIRRSWDSWGQSIEQNFNSPGHRLRSPKSNKGLQDNLIERPSSTSPYKSTRMRKKPGLKRRNSISNLLSSFAQYSFGSKSRRESIKIGSHDVSDSCGRPVTFVVIASQKMGNPHGHNLPSKSIESKKTSGPKPGIAEMNSTIEKVVNKMTECRHFYPPGFWETVSAGDNLLRRPKPCKALRDIPSMEDIGGSDLDRYLEESIVLRTPTLPQPPRPSSHRLRYVSTVPVRVKFPWSEHMELYASRDKAITDLFEKSSHLAERCIWDPVNRIFEAYEIGQKSVPALNGVNPDSKSYFWLPMHSWNISQESPLKYTTTSLENNAFRESELFDRSFIDEYESDFKYGYGSVENKLLKDFGALESSLLGTRCMEPQPSFLYPKAENESSLAVLSADEFDLQYEADSNMDQAIDGTESPEENQPLARSIKIQGIARPQSVDSPWYTPSNDSRKDTPSPTWTELERSDKGGQRLSQTNNVFGSGQSVNKGEPFTTCKVATAAVAKDAFNVDSFVWDGFYWNKILSCGLTSCKFKSPIRDIEVVAAADHVEHVSVPTDLETYFQPGQILRRDRTHDRAIGKSSAGPYLYPLACSHFHDAFEQFPSLRCSHRANDLFTTNERSAQDTFSELENILHTTAVQEYADSMRLDQRSTEGALSEVDDILRIAFTQDFQITLEEAAESCIEDERSNPLSEPEGILRITAAQNAIDTELFRNNKPLIEDALRDLSHVTEILKRSKEEGVLKLSQLQEISEKERSIGEVLSELAHLADIFTISAVQDGLNTVSFRENKRSIDDTISKLDTQRTATQDTVKKVPEDHRSTEESDLQLLSASTDSKQSLPSLFNTGFKFTMYSDTLENNFNSSSNQNEQACGVIACEDLNCSSITNERNPLAVLEDHNIRLVGKAASSEHKNNVRALVNIFQSKDIMSQAPPVLQSISSIGTPPGLRRSYEGVSELVLNIPNFVNNRARGTPGSRASDTDTDMSSEFGKGY